MDDLVINTRVRVPADAIVLRAVRSSGPGGQNVNKRSTKVELSVDLGAVVGLSPPQRARVSALTQGRRDRAGRLLVVCSETRSQSTNLLVAREKVRELIAAALPRPKRRVATKPSKASRRRRLETKRRQATKKQNRKWREED